MTDNKHECDLMGERLAAYLEGDLAPEERAAADEHLASCAACTAVLAELRTIAAHAAQLRPLSPTRDLWAGIESRIGTRVTALGTAPAHRAPRRPWPIAIAATALITLGVGTSYVLAARSAGTLTPATNAAQQGPVQHRDTVDATAPVVRQQLSPTPIAPRGVSLASHSKKDISAARVYDREISLLDSLVRTRREELDPKTVAVIEKNLSIIDSAIAESRAALAKDPKSPLLTNRLDNVLGSKVELLRTIAFLPSQS